jgi:hypothetical protein
MFNKKTNVTFRGDTLMIEKFKYQTGQTGLRLVDQYGAPYGTLTTYSENIFLQPNEIILKEYSENFWVTEFVSQYPNLFSDTGQLLPVGRATCRIFNYKG